MRFTEKTEFKKTFLIIHHIGVGTAEAPYIEKQVVFENDDENVAKREAERLESVNNPFYCDSWKENTYWVFINTATEKGKELYNEFGKKFDEILKTGLFKDEYNITQIGEHTYYTDKNLDRFFDDPAGANSVITKSDMIPVDLNQNKPTLRKRTYVPTYPETKVMLFGDKIDFSTKMRLLHTDGKYYLSPIWKQFVVNNAQEIADFLQMMYTECYRHLLLQKVDLNIIEQEQYRHLFQLDPDQTPEEERIRKTIIH